MIVSDTIWQPDLSGAGKSKYKALAQAIREGISAGHLADGSKLPPVRDLAYRLGVTPGTVARAYAVLTEEGRLVAQVGRGTFVAGHRTNADLHNDPLIYQVDEEMADFRSSRVPDVGQGLIIDEALIRVGQSHRRRHINYPTAETDHEVRDALLGWINPDQLGSLTADDIVLGNGAQNCCIIALQSVLRGQNPVILTEALGYPGARHAARLLRAELVGVAMDDEGMLPDALLHAYRQHGGQVLLTAPGVHSPTTTRTSLRRKQALAEVIDRLDLRVIEDDCYGIAPTDVPSYRMMMDGRAYFVSSLTKSVSGALRFGYLVSPVGEEAQLRQVAQSSFYGVAQPILDVVNDLLRSGAAANIRNKVVALCAKRVRMAVNTLGRWDIRWNEAAPFIWLQMPCGWRASSFSLACERRGIKVRPADEFALAHVGAPNAVRLALTTCPSEQQFQSSLDDMNDLLANPTLSMDG